jgi:hypothetical protein
MDEIKRSYRAEFSDLYIKKASMEKIDSALRSAGYALYGKDRGCHGILYKEQSKGSALESIGELMQEKIEGGFAIVIELSMSKPSCKNLADILTKLDLKPLINHQA